jgi:hypothetical protein
MKNGAHYKRQVMGYALAMATKITSTWFTLEGGKLAIQSFFHVCYQSM